MRMTRVFVEASLAPGRALELPAAAAGHLVKVLRARPGDVFTVFAGDGREFDATVTAIRGAHVSAQLGEARFIDRESPLRVTLLQGLPRGERMDLIVQKATELGVARIVPLLARRSVVRLDATRALAKAQHWHAIAVSACEQCGRNRIPAVGAPCALPEVLGATTDASLRLLLDPDAPAGEAPFDGASVAGAPAGGAPSAGAPSDCARAAGAATRAPAGLPTSTAGLSSDASIEVAVGPEGGFAPDELEAFARAGFVPVRLGPRVLRAETAAMVALTWLQSRFGDLGS
jgi:16S rRNA (uracil1498-N3)-methyltransferase